MRTEVSQVVWQEDYAMTDTQLAQEIATVLYLEGFVL